MLAFDSPALGLQIRIDSWDSSAQSFVAGDENDIGIVRRDGFGVVNRGQRPAQRVVFDYSSRDELVGSAKDVNERDGGRFVGHSMSILAEKASQIDHDIASRLSAANETAALGRLVDLEGDDAVFDVFLVR